MSSEREQKIANIFEGSGIKQEQFLSFWDRLSAQEQGELSMFAVEVSKETQATMEAQLQAAKAEADITARLDEQKRTTLHYYDDGVVVIRFLRLEGLQVSQDLRIDELESLTTPKEDKETETHGI